MTSMECYTATMAADKRPKKMAAAVAESGDSMHLLPRSKTLLGYARQIVRARGRMQINILREAYTRELPRIEEREVLDLLCHFYVAATEGRQTPPLTTDVLQHFVERGQAAQLAVDRLTLQYAELQINGPNPTKTKARG